MAAGWFEETKQRRVFRALIGYGIVWLALGDTDSAFAWIRKGMEERELRLDNIKVSPLWDPIRADPRFHALLRQMNLE